MILGKAPLRVVGKVPTGEVWILTLGLHGGEGDVSEELSRGRGCQVESGHVEVGVLLSHGVSVNLLENFIEAKLAKTLGRVTNHCGSPAKEKARDASLLHGE